MASPAVIERSPSTERIPPASRLILGRAVSQRKQRQSAGVGGRTWAPAAPPRLEELREILQWVLPSPVYCGNGAAFSAAVMADFAVVGLSYFAAARLFTLSYYEAHPWFTDSGAQVSSSAYGALLLQAALLTLIGYSEGLYSRSYSANSSDSWKLGRTVIWSTLLVWVGTQCGVDEIAVPVLLASAPLNYIGMLAWRRWRGWRSKRPGSHIRNVLIVGAGTTGRAVASYLEHDRIHAVRGFVCNDTPLGGDVLGGISNLAAIARAEFVDEVIVTIHEREAVRQAIWEAQRNRLDVKIVPDLLGFRAAPNSLEHLGDAAVLRLHEEPIPALQLALKRAMDVWLSGILLLLCSPLLALIALWVRLDSAGAVLYSASRVGRKGQPFTCYKFRTMGSDAEQWKTKLRDRNQREGPFFKIADDPRITRAGRLLRRYSLDELPQLWNVFKGDMSLVGPRPHPPDDYERYQLEHLRRLDVTPGLTGLWQVTARRDPCFERNMELDLEYIEHWSLALDMRILWKTVFAVLRGTGV